MKVRMRYVLVGWMICLSQAAESFHVTSTTSDRQSVALTVYNQGLASVREVRRVSLKGGEGVLDLYDLPETVLADSLAVVSQRVHSGFSVLSQTHIKPMVNKRALLEHFLGRAVRVRRRENGHVLEQTAILLSASDPPLLKIGEAVYLDYPATIILPQLPPPFNVIQSVVSWRVRSAKSLVHDLALTYLMTGIDWHINYVLIIGSESPSRKTLEGHITSWVDIENSSGVSYKDVAVQLMAGDVNVVSQRYGKRENMMMDAMSINSHVSAPSSMPVGDYHLYTLPEKVSLPARGTVQIPFFQPTTLSVAKTYVVASKLVGYRGWDVGKGGKPEDVEVVYQFRNTHSNGLGIPLPSGVVRAYLTSPKGYRYFSWADTVDRTAQEGIVRVQTGKAFDIRAERTLRDRQKKGKDTVESTWTLKIVNQKPKKITVRAIEHFSGQWRIVESTHHYDKQDAKTATFELSVGAGKNTTLTYRVLEWW